jgi:hypothetical protein
MDQWNPLEHPPYSPDLTWSMQFLCFSNHEKGDLRQEISKWSTVFSTFLRSGWSVVRSASLAKGGTSKKTPSPHLHKVLTWSNKVSPQTLQTTLVCKYKFHRLLWAPANRSTVNVLCCCIRVTWWSTMSIQICWPLPHINISLLQYHKWT